MCPNNIIRSSFSTKYLTIFRSYFTCSTSSAFCIHNLISSQITILHLEYFCFFIKITYKVLMGSQRIVKVGSLCLPVGWHDSARGHGEWGCEQCPHLPARRQGEAGSNLCCQPHLWTPQTGAASVPLPWETDTEYTYRSINQHFKMGER